MGRVYWTDEAASSLARLDARIQKALRDKASRPRDFPQMYPASEDPRFHDCRRLVVRPWYVVYYRVRGPEDDRFVIAIRDARAGAEHPAGGA